MTTNIFAGVSSYDKKLPEQHKSKVLNICVLSRHEHIYTNIRNRIYLCVQLAPCKHTTYINYYNIIPKQLNKFSERLETIFYRKKSSLQSQEYAFACLGNMAILNVLTPVSIICTCITEKT